MNNKLFGLIALGLAVIVGFKLLMSYYPSVFTTNPKKLEVTQEWINSNNKKYNYYKDRIKDLSYQLKYETDFIEKFKLSSAISSNVTECHDLVINFNDNKPSHIKPLEICK